MPASIGTAAIYQRLFAAMKPRTELPDICVEFRKYAGANAQIRLGQGVLTIRLSDTLAEAPEDVHEALAEILLSKLFRRPVPAASRDRYRRYLHRHDVRQTLEQVRSTRGRKRIAQPEGIHYNLVEVFEQLNARYFFGLMSRPRIGWSLQVSQTLLGHYDSAHHAIVLNRKLDHPEVPRLAVEYVMYHEMLHLRYPVEHTGARRCVHTKAFKEEEKKFEGLREAKQVLRRV
jgi:hypothetical protein